MRSAGWLGTLSWVALLASTGCTTTAFVQSGDLLWHPVRPVAVPDLSLAGWDRVEVEDADLAFSKPDAGVIAVRVRCPSPEEGVPLRWEGRQLWLGIPHGEVERFHLDVDGYEGVSMSAESDGLYLRTLTVRAERCSLDVLLVAPLDSGGDLLFEGFVAGLKLSRESG